MAFEIINEDVAVADHDAMRVFPFHNSSVALILELNCVRVNLQLAVVPVKDNIGGAIAARLSAALAVEINENVRMQSNKVAINRLFIKTPPCIIE